MWLKNPFARQEPEPIQKLTDAILELSSLLRVDLHSRGVTVSRRVPVRPAQKLTSSNVTILTRQDVLDQQIKDRIESERAILRPETS